MCRFGDEDGELAMPVRLADSLAGGAFPKTKSYSPWPILGLLLRLAVKEWFLNERQLGA